jgi:O-Antigen ligase
VSVIGPVRRDQAAVGQIRWLEIAVGSITIAVGLLAVVGPLATLAAAIAAGVVFAMAWRADVATIVFAFLFYANVLVVAARFHGVPTPLASTVVLLLLLPMIRSIVIQRSPIVVTPTLGLMFVFLTSMLLSTAASPAPGISLPVIGAFCLEGILLYFLVSNVANDVSRVRSITLVLVIAGVSMAALSVFQELTHSYDNNFFGFAQVSDGGFAVGDGTDVVLRQRLAGPIGEKNRYAQVLLMVVPLAYFAGSVAKRRLHRIFWYASAGIIAAGVFLTFSRGAAVAAFAVLLLMVFHRVISISRLVIILLTASVLMAVVAPDFVLRIASLGTVADATDTSANVDGAIRGRTTEALAAINVFVDHPIVGVGPNRFFREFSQIEANKLGLRHLDTNRRSHNLYLELAADQGLVGLGAFGLIMVATLTQLASARRRWLDRDPERAAMAAGMMFALYSYFTTAFFLQLSYQRYLWAMVALANGLIWSLRETDTVSPLAKYTGAKYTGAKYTGSRTLRSDATTPSEIATSIPTD